MNSQALDRRTADFSDKLAASRAVRESRNRSLAERRLCGRCGDLAAACRARRRRRPVQPRPGLSPRARRADQPVGGADMVRTRRQPGPSRCAGDTGPADVPERRPGRRTALAESRRAQGRAARAAGLRHGPVQRRRRHPGPGDGLRVRQPGGGAGTRPGQGYAGANGQDPPARRPQEGRRARHCQRQKDARAEIAHDHGQATQSSQASAAGRRPGDSQAETLVRCRCHNSGKDRRVASTARRVLAKIVGRSAVSQAFGSAALAGRHAFYIPVGAITRLQVGPFESRAAANAACSALKGQACFVVAAR